MSGLLVRIVGVSLFSVGFVVFWLPIPIGAIMMVIGSLMLFGKNPKWISFVQRRRLANPLLDRAMTKLASRMPCSIRHVIADTEPPPREMQAADSKLKSH